MLKAVEDKVIVKVDEEEKTTSSGFFLATADEKQSTGTVVARGPGIMLNNGDFVEIPFEVGDRVLFSKYAGTEVEHDGEKLTIFAYRDILAVVG